MSSTQPNDKCKVYFVVYIEKKKDVKLQLYCCKTQEIEKALLVVRAKNPSMLSKIGVMVLTSASQELLDKRI